VKSNLTNLRYTVIIAIIIFVLPLSLNFISFAKPENITVPDDYQTIQAAINEAEPYSTIYVRGGFYREHVLISKPLNIIGLGDNITIKAMQTGPVVKITKTRDVLLSGFIVDGSNLDYTVGIKIMQSSNITLVNNTIQNSFRGIYLWDTSNCTLKRNMLFGNKYDFEVWGLTLTHFIHEIDTTNTINDKPIYYLVNKKNYFVPSDSGYIALVNSSLIVVNNVNISENGNALLIAYSDECYILKGNFSNNVYGVRLVVSQNINVVNSSFSQNEYGMLCISSSFNQIYGNYFINNTNGLVFSYSSLITERSKYNTVEMNIFEDNNFGVTLLSSSTSNITMNRFLGNDVGLLLSSSHHNFIFHNSFVDNSVHVSTSSSCDNIWDLGYPIGGNYWCESEVKDFFKGPFQNETGSDLISDIPYAIDEENVDHFPLIPIPVSLELSSLSPKVSEKIFINAKLSSSFAVSILSWKWKVDDKDSFLNQSFYHVFSMSGNHTLSLEIFDERGVFGKFEWMVNVRGVEEVGHENEFYLRLSLVFVVLFLVMFIFIRFKWKKGS